MTRSKKMKLDLIRLAAVLGAMGLCFWGSQAMAETLVVKEGDKIKADLSLLYPTRFYFEYDAGAQLIFNQIEAGEGGDLSIPRVAATVDDKGDVYLSVTSGLVGQKVSGFLTTEGGRTYVIELTIQNKDADQVKIVSSEAREKALAAKSKAAAVVEVEDVKPVKWRKNANHHDAISDLMRTLYFGGTPEGFKKQSRILKRSQTLEDGVTFRVDRQYYAANVEAVVYDMTNTNGHFINPENYKRKFVPYLALAFQTDALEAGMTSKVYVIRQRGMSDGK